MRWSKAQDDFEAAQALLGSPANSPGSPLRTGSQFCGLGALPPFTPSSGNEDLRARAAHYDGDLDVGLSRLLTLVPNSAALPPVEVVELIPQGYVVFGGGGVSAGLAWQGLPIGKRPWKASQDA